ncbi:hexose kinase [Agromyces sp. G08B096]|uniref:Hexose kinase n=1 Tax=Agromyces sp. G08B096 TaxID=3156399 RepID=A0AAU7WCU8_9MICO
MILTVTPNPALDLTWHADELRPGETHRVATGAARAGGKGLNVARVLHGQGVDVLALTTGGGAAGAELTEELGRSGIPHRLVPMRGTTRRSVAIVDDAAGEATVLNELGAPLLAAEAGALLAEAERLGRAAAAVAVSGSLPPGLSPESVGDLIARLRAAGRPVVADVPRDALLAAARAGASVVKPNRDELAEATGETDPLTGARRLLELGAGVVVASLGADGLLAIGRDGGIHARLGRRLRGNATGAGDAAVAAIALTLAETRLGQLDALDADALDVLDPDALAADALARMAQRATAWSASAVLMPLAGDLHPDHAALEREIILEPVR